MSGNLPENLSGVWRLAVDFVRDRLRTRRTMREIAALDRNDARRVLAESGLSGAELTEVMSRPFALDDLMSRGMVAVGIDADEFAVRNADWYQTLQRNCALCRLRGRCRQVMMRSEFAQRFRDFCPNSGDFDEILATRAPSGAVYLDYVI